MPDIDFSQVRELAESLPDVVHTVSSRGEGLKVRGKLMVCQAVHKSADPDSIMARVSETERDRNEKHEAVLVRLSCVGRSELERLLKISSQHVFEKSQ